MPDQPDVPDTPDERTELSPAEVVVRPLPEPPATARSRVVALRTALPQLARHPVVVGATAAAATVAVRIAVDVARRAIGDTTPARPAALEVSGSVVHEVHVVHHVVHHVAHHVVHHAPGPVSLWIPVLPPRR